MSKIKPDSIRTKAKTESLKSIIKDFNSQDVKMCPSYLTFTSEIWSFVLASDNTYAYIGLSNSVIKQINLSYKIEENDLLGHSGGVTTLRISKDNSMLVSGSLDSTIRIWNLKTCQETSILNIFPAKPLTLRLSSRNSLIFISCSDASIRKWPFSSTVSLTHYSSHTGKVNSLALTSDDLYLLSSSDDCTIKLWNTHTNKLEHTFEGHISKIETILVSNNKEFFASGSEDKTVRIWNLKNKELEACFEGHHGEIYCLAISKNDLLVASGSQDKKVIVWDVQKKHAVHSHTDVIGYVSCLEFSVDSKYIISGGYKNIIIANILAKRTEIILEGHSKFISGILCTSDNKFLVSVSVDKTLRVWDINENKYVGCLSKHTNSVSCVRASSDHRILATGSWDHSIILWDIISQEEICTLKGHMHYVSCLEFSTNSRFLVSASWDCKVLVWSIDSRSEILCFEGHEQLIHNLLVTKTFHNIISCSGDGMFVCWNTDKKSEEFSLKHEEYISHMEFSNNEEYVITSSADKYIRFISLTKKSVEHKFLHQDSIWSFVFAEKIDLIFAGVIDREIVVWDFATLSEKKRLTGLTTTVKQMAVSNDKHLITSGNDHFITIWNIKSLNEYAKFDCGGNIESIFPLKNSNFLISTQNNGNISIWNISEKREEFSLQGHHKAIDVIEVSPDQKYFFTGSKDTTVKVWPLSEYLGLLGLEYNENIVLDDDKELSKESVSLTHLSFEVKTKDSFNFTTFCIHKRMFYQGFRQRLRKKLLPLDTDCDLLLPYGVNVTHFYSYLGYDRHLKEALDLGCGIKRDNFGHSPLFYALEKESKNCIEVLLEFMIMFSKKDKNYCKYLEYSYALRGDIYRIIMLDSNLVPGYLNSIFRIVVDHDLPNYVIGYNSPILHISDSQKIYIESFTQMFNEKKYRSETFIGIRTTPFKLSLHKGSKRSFRLISSLILSQNPKVYSTRLIQSIIDYKWKEMKMLIIFLTAILWINLSVMIVLINQYSDIRNNMVYLITNLFLLVSEIFQMNFVGIKLYLIYWRNISDLTSITVSLLWVYFRTTSLMVPVTWTMVLLNSLKGLSGFRAFSSTRYYVRLIYRAIYDVYAFILIFLYTTLAFGALYSASFDKLPDAPFQVLWRIPFDLNLGSYSSINDFSFEYVCFILAAFINVIIMLNLLISILGDSFDRFQIEALEIDYREKLEFLIEAESIYSIRRFKGKKGFIQVCEAEERDSGESQWAGKIKEFNAKVDKGNKRVEGKIKRIQGSISEIMKTNLLILKRLETIEGIK